MSSWRDFGGINEGYVLELYERFQKDPSSVDAASRAMFEQLGQPGTAPGTPHPAPGTAPGTRHEALGTVVGAVNLAESIRRYGHLAARIDPLGTEPVGDPALLPETHGVSEHDLAELPASLVGGPLAEGAAHAGEAIARLRHV